MYAGNSSPGSLEVNTGTGMTFPLPPPSESQIATTFSSDIEDAGSHAMESSQEHYSPSSISRVMLGEPLSVPKEPTSPSSLTAHLFNTSGGESPTSDVDSMTLPPALTAQRFPTSGLPDLKCRSSEVTPALPCQPSDQEPEHGCSSVDGIQEHIASVPPHLQSIPEEATDSSERTSIINPPHLFSASPSLPPTAGPSKVATISNEQPDPSEWNMSALVQTGLGDDSFNSSPSLPLPLSLRHIGPATDSIASTLDDLQPLQGTDAEEGIAEEDNASTIFTNDNNSSYSDEDYYSDSSSHTASLLSDVKNYWYENGRRYHAYREGHYVLPNDEQEQDRQDLLHHVRSLVLCGALHRAPLESTIQRVLDIGTGTGIWAIDFADNHPSAEVIGTDLSPIQPSWVPPNLRFLVDDAESPWLFSTNRPFDFVHARDLGGAIADWPRLLQQAYIHLRPGGWIELQEFEVTLKSDDDSLRQAPTLCEFLGHLHQASEAFHRPMNIAEGHRQRLIEAGFEEVRDDVYKVPSSSWPDEPIQKQIGRYNLCSLLMAVESYSLALFTRVLGWSNTQTQIFLAGVRKDLRNPEVHTYCNLHIVYGRKPKYDYRGLH